MVHLLLIEHAIRSLGFHTLMLAALWCRTPSRMQSCSQQSCRGFRAVSKHFLAHSSWMLGCATACHAGWGVACLHSLLQQCQHQFQGCQVLQ